jgi:hypothetical protein
LYWGGSLTGGDDVQAVNATAAISRVAVRFIGTPRSGHVMRRSTNSYTIWVR